MLLAAAGTVAYWLAYFFAHAVQTADDPVYLGFEAAFPLADSYMATAYLVSAIALLRGHVLAVPAGLVAGSAMVFLGCMDMLFNLEHGKYADLTAAMAIETAINAACLTLGPVTIVRLWRIRGRLAG